MNIAAITLTPDTMASALGAYTLPMPNDTDDYMPTLGGTVRVIAGEYRGQWGTCIDISEDSWSCLTVEMLAGGRAVLSPYEVMR